MRKTSLLGLGVVLAFLGPFFFAAGYMIYNSSRAFSLEIMGLYMTGFGFVLVMLVVLNGSEKKKPSSSLS